MDASLGAYKDTYRSNWIVCTLPWQPDVSSRTKYVPYNSTPYFQVHQTANESMR
ncbi:hypothetical protein CAAN4_G09384 [[Candida] anglica]|uniref:Uncharacterized protein n=1 Tax=[Candida] anglica TaxID=148631 RepID=A0ABP0EHL9_9ASCO